MSDARLRKLVSAALLGAMCCVATMVIRVPSLTGGYVNPGDAIVVLSGFLLGPYWGAAAAGIGSSLADLLSGYIAYAPATLVIKALMALVAGAMLKKSARRDSTLSALAAACVAELIMLAGYFIFTFAVLGLGWGALMELPGNAVQGVFGAAAGSALNAALIKLPYIRRLRD